MSCIRDCIKRNPRQVEAIFDAGARFIRDQAAKQGVVVSEELEKKLKKFAIKQGLIEVEHVDEAGV